MIKLDVRDIALIKNHRGVVVALMGDFPTYRIEFDTSSEARSYLKSLHFTTYRMIDLVNDVEQEMTL